MKTRSNDNGQLPALQRRSPTPIRETYKRNGNYENSSLRTPVISPNYIRVVTREVSIETLPPYRDDTREALPLERHVSGVWESAQGLLTGKTNPTLAAEEAVGVKAF